MKHKLELEKAEEPDQIANIFWIIEKPREFQKNIYFCFIDYAKALTYSFPYLEQVYCSMSSSTCCFLTCIQVSQEAGKVVWFPCLFKNLLQFVEIHTVKGFGIINKAEIDVFLEFSCFFDDPTDVGNLISGSPAFSKTSLYTWKFSVHLLLKPNLKNFEHFTG